MNRRRWRRVNSTVHAVVCIALTGCASPTLSPLRTLSPSPTVSPFPAGKPDPGPAAPEPVITYPQRGDGVFQTATTDGPVAGHAGRLLRYRVSVEQGVTGIDATAFAEQVSGVLSDPRGWTGTGRWRLQLVPDGVPHDFVVYLATPATRDTLCAKGYDRYTSCRNGNRVVLNVARWVNSVPDYGADLATYRQYLVNHETGHRLGLGHEKCPAPGRPAPVMQQQTLGLHGCVANGWPIVDGRPYSGPAGQYNDPIPADSVTPIR
ncbi:MAG TPA: DUF3152 domain-containing protein [Candidatus Limnocylindrales bacterium]